MEIAFLVKGKKTRDRFSQVEIPYGIKSSFGVYKAEGGDLYFATFAVEGDTLKNARILSDLRDDFPANENVRLLRDDASAKYCEILYPLYCRFEKGLREALTIACCAEQGNFEDKDIAVIENKNLTELYKLLFIDTRYIRDIRDFVNRRDFTSAEFHHYIESTEENTFWDTLFAPDDMTTFRDRREIIRNYRNDVMHFHKVSEERFDEIRKLLKTTIKEIESYIKRARSDVSFAKEKAANARVAARILNENLINLDKMTSLANSLGLAERLLSDSAVMKANFEVSSQMQEAIAHLNAQNSISNLISDKSIFNLGLSQSVSNAINALDINKLKLPTMSESSKRFIEAAQKAEEALSSSAMGDFAIRYQQILDQGAFKSLRQAAITSMDFNAGLNIGTALSDIQMKTEITEIEHKQHGNGDNEEL